MAVAQLPFLAAVLLLLLCSGFYCSSAPLACPESCTCQRAPLVNCSSSGLSLVPQHIQDSVTELDLSHNLLGFVTLHRPHHNLRSVWLGNNSITHLSLCIERAPGSPYVRGRRLHHLRLRSRGCVSWAPTLQLLSVERNQLVQLPEGLNGSESLQVLQLSFNRISTLQPGILSNLRQLKELHLQHNLITSFHPQMFQDLVELKVLDLSFNILTILHPLTYLSLRNIGATVSLGGNPWQCDCDMRSLRRRMAYDSSRSLQSWSIVCASPPILSGRDLLQLEENDLKCFNTENRQALHQDLTVYSGSEILLSCSAQDSLWWTPNGQASVSHPQAGLLIRDITEREAGLYVCVSEEHEVVSVYNLQISKTKGTRRKPRSLSRMNPQIIAPATSIGMRQARNQTATQSDLTLAVCLSVFITFLIAFILGVLARPLFDILWRRVTKKKSTPETNSVSSIEEQQYDNVAYNNSDEPEERGPHRERRVTFSDVQYYDTVVASGEQGSINNDQVFECVTAEADEDKNTSEDSGSTNGLQQKSPEDNQQDGRDQTHNMEFEQIQDPVELEERISLSSHSDSSLSDKEFKKDKMTQGHYSTPKSPLLVEDSVQQRDDFSTQRKDKVPQISNEGTKELPGYSSEPFVDWLPNTNSTNLTELPWQDNEEPFEFSDSVRSTSARSNSLFGSYNDLHQVPTSDKQKESDMSSSSSHVSKDEPTNYIVNSDQEEEEDMALGITSHNKTLNAGVLSPPAAYSSCSESETEITNHKVKHIEDTVNEGIKSNKQETVNEYPETQRPVDNLEHAMHIKRHQDVKAPSPTSDSSSSSDSEDETTGYIEKQTPGKGNITFQESQAKSHDPETQWPTLDLKHTMRIKRCLDIKTPPPASTSSSSSDSDDQSTIHINKQEQAFKVSPTLSHKPETQWPKLNLEHTPNIKRHLDIKEQSASSDSSSSSDSEDEKTGYMEKQRLGKVNIAGLPLQESQEKSHNTSSSSDSDDETTNSIKKQKQAIKVSQTLSQKPETQWPKLNLEHIPHIKRRLDIRAPSPSSDSSSSSDSEDEKTGYIEKQRPGKVNIAGLLFQEPQEKSHNPETQWPTLDLNQTTQINRRLDIKAPSPSSDSSSSSDSEDEKTGYVEKQRPRKVNTVGLPLQESQEKCPNPETQWPTLDLEHTTRIRRRLDMKAALPASDSSSSSDSDDETTNPIKKQKQAIKVSQTESHTPKTQWPELSLEHIPQIKRHLDIKAPSPSGDSSSSGDSENETKGFTEKQRLRKVKIAELPFQEPQAKSHYPEAKWPKLDLEHTTLTKRRLDIKSASPGSDSSSSSDSDDEATNPITKQKQAIKVSQIVSHTSETQWPKLNLEHIPNIKRRLDIRAPSPSADSSSSSDSENETSGYIVKQRPGKVNIAGLLFQEPQEKSHNPETQWPTLDLNQTTQINRRLDIKAPSPSSDSSSSSDSEDEKTGYVEKQRPGKVNTVGLPLQESQEKCPNPETQWPTLDLEHTTRIRRRLDMKAALPASDSSSSSDSDETTNPIKNQKQAINVSQTESHTPKTQWPELSLEHIPQIKRHLDIKAPSPSGDSSSSGDSENETKGFTEKQSLGKVKIAELPFQEPQAKSHYPEAKWPKLDLEHTTLTKRRLDIKSAPPVSDSSSSSDSDDETTNPITKQKQAIKVSQTVNHTSETQWPKLNLEHIPHIKRRLDIRAPSPSSDSSSSSDSENETTGYIEKQRPGKVNIAGLLFQEPQEKSHNPKIHRLTPDLEHTIYNKRRLDMKAAPPASDSSSSSDSDDEATNPIKKQQQAIKVSQTESHKPETQWPKLNLEHIPHIKRHLDIRAPSPSSASSSSSDSEDEITGYIEKQRPGKVNIAGLPFQESQAKCHDPEAEWPKLDLEHTTLIKRRLDIKSAPPASDSSSSSDSDDETTNPIKKQKQVIKVSQTVSHTPETQWPKLDLERTTLIKRRLDLKSASPADSSSSSDSEDGTTDQREKQRSGVREFSGLPYHKSQWPAMDIGEVTHIKRHLDIKVPSTPLDSLSQGFRQSESNTSTSDSDDEIRDTKGKQRMGANVVPKATEEFIGSSKITATKFSPSPKTDQNIKLEKYTVLTDDLWDKATSDNISTNQELHSQWATMNLGFSRFRKRLDITPHTHKPPNLPSSSPPEHYSSSSSESGIVSKSDRTKQNKGGIVMQGITSTESSLKGRDDNSDNSVEIKDRLRKDYRLPTTEEKDHSVPDLSLGVPRVKRCLDIKAPSPPPSSSPSSCSDDESEEKGYTAKQTYSRHTSKMSRMTDDDSLINYKRLIIKSSLPIDSSPSVGIAPTTDHTRQRYEAAEMVTAQEGSFHSVEDRNATLDQRRVPMTFDEIVKKRIKRFRNTKDADMPPEIMWRGVGRNLSDLSIPSTRKHLDGSLSSQQAPPAKPEHPQPHSSNSSSSESGDETKQEREKADAIPAHKDSPLSPRSVSLSSKIDRSDSNTNEIWRNLSKDRGERKGLSALKAMSSQRQKWETEDKQNDKDTAPPFDEYNNMSNLPLSTSVNEKRTADLVYDIPQYRRHVIEAIDPPQELPPPIPATPLPDEAADFTWRSPRNT